MRHPSETSIETDPLYKTLNHEELGQRREWLVLSEEVVSQYKKAYEKHGKEVMGDGLGGYDLTLWEGSYHDDDSGQSYTLEVIYYYFQTTDRSVAPYISLSYTVIGEGTSGFLKKPVIISPAHDHASDENPEALEVTFFEDTPTEIQASMEEISEDKLLDIFSQQLGTGEPVAAYAERRAIGDKTRIEKQEKQEAEFAKPRSGAEVLSGLSHVEDDELIGLLDLLDVTDGMKNRFGSELQACLTANGLDKIVGKQVIGEGLTAYYTPVFRFGKTDRDHVIAYTYNEQRQLTVPSIYYLSNSHAEWKTLLGFDRDASGREIAAKGSFSETEFTLPWATQSVLHTIKRQAEPNIIEDGFTQAMLMEAFTLVDYEDVTPNIEKQITELYAHHKIVDQDLLTLLSKPDNFKELAVGSTLPKRIEPNIEDIVGQWSGENQLYGSIEFVAVGSQDGAYIYTFARNDEHGVWLANIEPGETGIRESGIRDASLVTHIEVNDGAINLIDPPVDHAKNLKRRQKKTTTESSRMHDSTETDLVKQAEKSDLLPGYERNPSHQNVLVQSFIAALNLAEKQ